MLNSGLEREVTMKGSWTYLGLPLLFALLACGPGFKSADTASLTSSPSAPTSTALGPRYGIQPQFCAEPEVQVTEGDVWSVESAHYELSVGTSWSREEALAFGRLAEAAWPAMEHYFGAPALGSDGGPLEGHLFDTEQAWGDAIAADGLPVPWGAGGLFHASTGRVYLWRQPEAYSNQMLLVHEMTHQYHHFAVDSQADAVWFIEGVAEYLSRHDWDERCVRLGVVPTGTLEDAHGAALENWEAGYLDPGQMVADPTDLSRPNAMAWFAYLEETHGTAFRTYRDGVDAGGVDEEELFLEILGEPGAYAASFEAWLASHQEPLEVAYTGWRHVDQNHIEADASGTGTVTFAPLKTTPATFSFSAEALADPFETGALVSYEDWDNWTVLLASASGDLNVLRYDLSGGWWWSAGTIDPPGDVLSAEFPVTDDVTDLTLNGQPVTYEHGQLGAAGLAIYDAKILFEFELD